MKKSKFCLMIVICSLLFLLHVHASVSQQSIAISGKVTDRGGVPLPGVSILVEGTSTGTVSDSNGQFSLSILDENSVLLFSFIGYETQRIVVGQKRIFSITMYEIDTNLDEVVVVAYGSQKKVSVTGAISTVQTKELKQSSAANFTNALVGRLPGLTLLQTSGKPGEDTYNMYLRGRGTTNGYDPLILIDGVPRSDINVIDPNEIASVSILKDASATAVFGVRGANGVILITTRRGETDKAEFSISVDQSMQQFTSIPDRVHSWEFAELRNQAARNDGIIENNLPYTPYMIQMYKSGKDPVFYPDRDVYHDFFKDWTPQTRINANLNGGTKNLKYFVNGGYIGQAGNVKTAPERDLGYDPSFRLDRYRFRTNIDYQIARNLKLSLNLASYMDKINSPQCYENFSGDSDYMTVYIMVNTLWTPPTDPGPLTVGGYGVPVGQPLISASQTAPMWSFINKGYHEETATTLNSSVKLDWGLDFITKGLSTQLMLSYDTKARTVIDGYKDLNLYQAVVPREEGDQPYYATIQGNATETLNLVKRYGAYYYMNIQYSLNYLRQFGRHNLTGMILFQRDNWQNTSWTANSDLPYNMLGLVGRIAYDFDGRYLAEVNLGYNGSEQFAPGNRFGFFPAFSAGWVVSNETFLKDNPILTYLKLRASYGKVGNDKMGGTRFLYISELYQSGGGMISSLGYGNQIYHGRIGNEKLQWEVAEKQNYGLEFKLFNNLSLSFDKYFEKRNEILITRGTVPALQGVDVGLLPKANMGKVDNRGYEIELTYRNQINTDFKFEIRGNYAYNKNKVLYLDEPLLAEDYTYRYRSTGYSIGQQFGYLIDYSNGNGYINTEEELNNLLPYNVGGTPRLGDFKYVDTNHDQVIDTKDMVPIGYTQIPRVTYGLAGNLNYKNIDFSILFTGIGQSSLYLNEFLVTELGFTGFYNNMHKQAWTQERYENGEKISYPALSTTEGSSIKPNSFFLWNRSFLRLKSAEIGYTLPQRLTQTVGVSRARFYVNGNNLWLLWKKYPFDTVDPEQIASRTYPITRMITAGVNVVF
ncbi:MAG: SusC/RagA family TonB-linked outer membrane protein [Mangrovibacterium sp.]